MFAHWIITFTKDKPSSHQQTHNLFLSCRDLAALPSSFRASHVGHPLTSKISTHRHNDMGGCLLNERPANSGALPMCFIVTFKDKLSLMFMRKSETSIR